MNAARNTVLPDALLVERMAALSDRAALAELDARHGLTLYAIAYALMFDGEAADAAVAAVFREAWRSAASYDPRDGSVARWLANLTRGAVRDQVRSAPRSGRSAHVGRIVAAGARAPRPPVAPASDPRRRRAGWTRLPRVAAIVLLPAILLAATV